MNQNVYYVSTFMDLKDRPVSISALSKVFGTEEEAMINASSSFNALLKMITGDTTTDVAVTREDNVFHAILDDTFEILYVVGSHVVTMPYGKTINDITSIVSFNAYDAFKDYIYTDKVMLRGYDTSVTDMFFNGQSLSDHYNKAYYKIKRECPMMKLSGVPCVNGGVTSPGFVASDDGGNGYFYNSTVIK